MYTLYLKSPLPLYKYCAVIQKKKKSDAPPAPIVRPVASTVQPPLISLGMCTNLDIPVQRNMMQNLLLRIDGLESCAPNQELPDLTMDDVPNKVVDTVN